MPRRERLIGASACQTKYSQIYTSCIPCAGLCPIVPLGEGGELSSTFLVRDQVVGSSALHCGRSETAYLCQYRNVGSLKREENLTAV